LIGQLTDLAGQSEAVARLRGAVSGGRVHHALLFVGPDGVGKAIAAKLLAQVLLCTGDKSDPIRACGSCPSCIKITTAGHADVHLVEPDDKDSIKVDAIREMSQMLQLRPMEGRFRISIVRDADRMNPQAQNALLKTLEEPPGSAHLVLTTSRPQAILPTVLSRCQKVPFAPVPSREIAALLVREKGSDEKSALLLAALAQGAPGRAFAGDAGAVVEARDRAREIDRRLYGRSAASAKSAMQAAAELVEDKEELGTILSQLGVWLRDQIVVASGAQNAELANADQGSEIEALAAERGLFELLRRARALEHAERQLAAPFNLNPLLVVEQLCLALAGWGERTAA
jgi:DNA polymerase III subunit delta'